MTFLNIIFWTLVGVMVAGLAWNTWRPNLRLRQAVCLAGLGSIALLAYRDWGHPGWLVFDALFGFWWAALWLAGRFGWPRKTKANERD